MRLVTYERRGARRLGATVGDVVVDLPDAVGHPAFPRTMEELVAHTGGTVLAAARSALDHPDAVAEFGVLRPRLLSPLLPSAFVEMGPSAGGSAGPAGEPMTRVVLGPADDLLCPASIRYLGCHVDVGAVVGRPRRTRPSGGGDGAIFGYTVMVRWFGSPEAGAGSEDSLPFATSLGPSIVTPDEVALAGTIATVAVDGEVVATSRLRQDGRVAALITRAVRDDDADPGDVFASTAFGASFELTLDRAAAAGAVIEVSVDGIGSLTTRVAP
jgi:hypothetical protein